MTVDFTSQIRTLRTLVTTRTGPVEPEVLGELAKQISNWVAPLPEGICEDPEIAETLLLVQSLLSDGHVPKTGIKKGMSIVPEEIAKGGWIAQYLKFTEDNEAPTIFHFFCALTALGALLSRRVFFSKGHYKVFTSMATILVAPSGICRKSTATNIAIRTIRELSPDMLLSSKLTAEALVAALAGRNPAAAIVHAPELSVFIGKQRYLEGLIQILTDLLDCPDSWSSETIMRGQNPLYNVALSLLGASTPDWLVTSIPKDAFGGGFMSRLLIVSQTRRERIIALPEPRPERQWLLLLHELGIISQARGSMRLSKAARGWYEQWYQDHQRGISADERFAGYQQRKPDHLLRIAMLLHLSRHALLEIGLVSLERSLAVLNYLEESLPETFRRIALSGVGEDHVKILQHVRREGGLSHSVLMKKMYNMNRKQFREAVETLKEQGLLVEISTPYEHTYHPVAERDD